MNFPKYLRKKNTNSTPTLQNTEKEKLSNSFYEARVTDTKNIHFNGKTTDDNTSIIIYAKILIKISANVVHEYTKRINTS